ncbi:MAG: sensor domain-containing diguanylate cyclase [Pseudomonadota bacterium]
MKLNCRIKLIISISLLVGICQLATGFVIINQTSNSLLGKHLGLGRELAENISDFSTRAMVKHDLASLYEQIDIAMKRRNVRHVIIVDPSNTILVSDDLSQAGARHTAKESGRIHLGETNESYPIYREKSGEIISEITVPVTLAGDILGYVILGYSQSEVRDKISSLKQQTVITLLLGLSGAFLITALLTSMITRPLFDLEKTALQISAGDFDIQEPDAGQNDEFSLLNKTIYSMARRLQELVYHDPLTGLYNRQLLNIRLSEEMARSRRHQWPLAVLLVDIDHFKRINDTYGHLVGDEMLVAVTRIIADHIREEDCLARFGGEEFIILAPGMSEDNARKQLAERIRKAVARKIFTPETEEERLRMTISVGFAVYPIDAKGEKELLTAADRALYAAKDMGRNQVVSFSELPADV